MSRTKKTYINLTVNAAQKDGSQLLVSKECIGTFTRAGDAAIAARALNEAGAPGFSYVASPDKIQPYDFINRHR